MKKISEILKENIRMKKALNKLANLELPATLDLDKSYEELYGTVGIKHYVQSVATQALGGINRE